MEPNDGALSPAAAKATAELLILFWMVGSGAVKSPATPNLVNLRLKEQWELNFLVGHLVEAREHFARVV